jgi:hypothetical protein
MIKIFFTPMGHIVGEEIDSKDKVAVIKNPFYFQENVKDGKVTAMLFPILHAVEKDQCLTLNDIMAEIEAPKKLIESYEKLIVKYFSGIEIITDDGSNLIDFRNRRTKD